MTLRQPNFSVAHLRHGEPRQQTLEEAASAQLAQPASLVLLVSCVAGPNAALRRVPARFSQCPAGQLAANARRRWPPAAAAEPAPARVRKRGSLVQCRSSMPPSRARRALLRRRAAPRLSAPSKLRRRCHRRPQLARCWLAAGRGARVSCCASSAPRSRVAKRVAAPKPHAPSPQSRRRTAWRKAPSLPRFRRRCVAPASRAVRAPPVSARSRSKRSVAGAWQGTPRHAPSPAERDATRHHLQRCLACSQQQAAAAVRFERQPAPS